jgi:hypothetical protein
MKNSPTRKLHQAPPQKETSKDTNATISKVSNSSPGGEESFTTASFFQRRFEQNQAHSSERAHYTTKVISLFRRQKENQEPIHQAKASSPRNQGKRNNSGTKEEPSREHTEN